MCKVLFLVNHDVVIYNFRLELVERLLADGHEVVISSPYGDRIEDLKKLGCDYKEIAISRHGVNPIKDLKLIKSYKKLLREVKPDIVFSYTIKPNIYGAIACKSKKIPIVANITGLGTAVEQKGILQLITLSLYKYAFKKVKKVFFQNEENQRFFRRHKIALNRQDLLPGSGVNLERFPVLEYPDGKTVKFVFIGRIMREKGIDFYLDAAEYIKSKYTNTEFHVCGFVEAEYKGKLEDFIRRGIIIYHGLVKDVSAIHIGMLSCGENIHQTENLISKRILSYCYSGFKPSITMKEKFLSIVESKKSELQEENYLLLKNHPIVCDALLSCTENDINNISEITMWDVLDKVQSSLIDDTKRIYEGQIDEIRQLHDKDILEKDAIIESLKESQEASRKSILMSYIIKM